MRVFAVYNIKGGVGKTTTAVNLAYYSARAGARTLLWDLDPQGAASFYFRVKPEIRGPVKRLFRGEVPLEDHVRETDYEGLDLLPADFRYRKLERLIGRGEDREEGLARIVAPLARRYDHLYLDCAPSVSPSADGIFGASDTLLVPTIPTTLAVRALEQLVGYLGERRRGRPRVMAFWCLVDRRKSMHREIAARREFPGVELLETEIPYASVIERMGVERAPVAEYERHGDAARAYSSLWSEILRQRTSWLGWLRGQVSH